MPHTLILGAGQAGTFVAKAVAEAGKTVVAADIDPAPGYFARFGPRTEAQILKADILDRETIMGIIKAFRIQNIILSAGPVGAACAKDPKRAWQTNVEGAKVVAEAALTIGIRRLVFISSLAVYGGAAGGPISESTPIQPLSEYGRTKAAAEAELDRFREKGLDIRIIRPCGIYGPVRFNHGSQSAQFIEAVLFSAATRRQVTIKALPEASDEYLYARDLGRAVAMVSLREPMLPEYVFNVGWGKKTTIHDLLEAVAQVVPGVEVGIEIEGSHFEKVMGPLDVSRIRQAFDFEPQYDLVKGLADYLQEARFSV
jgi:UDP-glucose 4-epimerase